MKKSLLLLLCSCMLFAGCSTEKLKENKKENAKTEVKETKKMTAEEQKVFDKIVGKFYVGENEGMLIVYDAESAKKVNEDFKNGFTDGSVEIGDLFFSRMQIPLSNNGKEPTTVIEEVRLKRETEANKPVLYKNARVVMENGLLFLTADNFPYRVQITENGFKELDEGNVYREAPKSAEK